MDHSLRLEVVKSLMNGVEMLIRTQVDVLKPTPRQVADVAKSLQVTAQKVIDDAKVKAPDA